MDLNFNIFIIQKPLTKTQQIVKLEKEKRELGTSFKQLEAVRRDLVDKMAQIETDKVALEAANHEMATKLRDLNTSNTTLVTKIKQLEETMTTWSKEQELGATSSSQVSRLQHRSRSVGCSIKPDQ